MGCFLNSTTKKDKLMSSTNFNPTRGMRDFLPAETLQREKVLQTIQSYYKVNGFLPINTPIVESIEFLSKGNENSENAKLGFGVMSSKSSNESAKLGLRYDLTVPLARFYAANKTNLPSPFRVLQVGDVFRAERPQRGRYRQFLQCDIDALGDNTIMAEMDILSTSMGLLNELGLKQITLNINDKSFLVSLLTSYGFNERELP
jgi:histidyl-tRNA synthetase